MKLEERQAIYRSRLEQADRAEPVVEVLLQHKAYKLEFNNRAAKDIFNETGVLILTGQFDKLDDPNVLSVVLQRGLQKHHGALDIDWVDDVINAKNRLYIVARLIDALVLFQPDLSDLPQMEIKEAEVAEDPSLRGVGSGSAIKPLPEDSEFLGPISGS